MEGVTRLANYYFTKHFWMKIYYSLLNISLLTPEMDIQSPMSDIVDPKILDGPDVAVPINCEDLHQDVGCGWCRNCKVQPHF